MEQKSNKQIVLECYRKIIRDLDFSLVDTYISDNYIQHSPTVKDGKAGLLQMLGFLKTLPQPAEHGPSPIIRTIAGGDLVAVHLDVKFMNQRVAVVDIFRVTDGKIAEHWDVGQALTGDESGDITMTNGTAVIDGLADSEKNKELINAFFLGVLADGNAAAGYVCDDFIEHDISNGLLNDVGEKVVLYRLITEGDFVVAHSEVKKADKVFARADIFRIAVSRIAEHWSVEQTVPDVMAHANGMF